MYTASVCPWNTMDLQVLRPGSPESHHTWHMDHFMDSMAATTAYVNYQGSRRKDIPGQGSAAAGSLPLQVGKSVPQEKYLH